MTHKTLKQYLSNSHRPNFRLVSGTMKSSCCDEVGTRNFEEFCQGDGRHFKPERFVSSGTCSILKFQSLCLLPPHLSHFPIFFRNDIISRSSIFSSRSFPSRLTSVPFFYFSSCRATQPTVKQSRPRLLSLVTVTYLLSDALI